MCRQGCLMVAGVVRRAKRWIAGGTGVGVIVATAVTFGPLTTPAHAAVGIPSNYFTVVDTGGVDDENGGGQLDLTQLGRDDSDANYLNLFWSWDDTSFTNQTGDACA